MVPVLFLLLPGSLLLDWAGPAEALRIANQVRQAQGQPPAFDLRFIGPLEQPATSVGPRLAGIEPLPAALPDGAWLVLVGMPGNHLDLRAPGVKRAIDWLRALRPWPAAARLVTVCAGSLLAAHAGLLDGRRATTHHSHLDELRAAAPHCDVAGNRVFVIDGPVASSAGVTTGIDLALHLVAQECGAVVASRVAQTMVLALRRGPQDPELSPFLAHRNHLHAALHRVQDAVSAEPQQAWDVPAMARIAHTSTRHLTRLFVEHAGVAPLEYLRRIRLSVAQAALATGRNVTQAAQLAGFGSDTQLRRAWRQFGLAGTPSSAAGLLQNS
ncbi:GlxA family transcriptional regulator [Ramlibacter albus]|uniref:Helix-turn-helix domain-containing protein n=1 Tax=Ramlibacter albus TaxID=2079448 RepID=A0A923MEA1_9BURK|nr:helix-turn-helix domain-containing protein [Ramlibacter albus]MBC5767417.1 helix-turn-helix domain-containing protein [Ramlibacter albus]